MRSNLKYASLAAVIVIYTAVRLLGLTGSCLWFDEIFSVHAAEHAWNELFQFVALDLIHPPLFYVLLKLWIAVGGESLLWLRLLPILFSLIAVVPFLLLCAALNATFWPRVLGLFLLATNGSLIKYAQEVRMYSLLMCLSLFSMWLFARYFDRGKSVIWLLIVNILLVHSHYFGWFVVSAEVVAVFVLQRAKGRRIVAMFGVVVASFLPWAIAVWQAARGGSYLGQNIGWMSRPGIREVGTFILDLVEPFYYQASSTEPASIYRVSVPILQIVLVAFILYFVNWKHRTVDEKRTIYFLSILAGLPVAAAFIASWLLPYAIWGTRHLIVVFAPFCVLAAIVIMKIGSRIARTAAITLVLLFTGLGIVTWALTRVQVYSWCQWDELGVHAAERSPGIIYVFEDIVAYHIWYGLENRARQMEVRKIKNMPGVNEDTAYFLPRGFDEIKSVELVDVKERRFWIAYRAEGLDETRLPLKSFIDAGHKIADRTVLPATQENSILLLLEKGTTP